VALLLLVVAGCTTYRLRREAQLAEAREDWDSAVVHYLDLVEQEPSNVRYKTALLRAKIRASQVHFDKGRRFHEAGVLERALVEYQQAVALDPTNQYAQVELDKAREQIASSRDAAVGGSSLDELKKKTRDAPPQPPVLNPRSKAPISLEFPRAVSIFDIYRALGKAFGINVLFDPQLKDQELAIELRDVTAQIALETLMRAAGHFYKVIDEHTILIAADTQQNRKTYEDLVIQTFFLSNAEVKDVLTLLRSLIGAKNVATNEQLNAVTIRDTADRVKVAQRIIEGIDKSRSEVVIDVELIEVNTTKLRDLGLSLSNYQVTQSLDLGENAKIRFSDLSNLTRESWVLTIPSIIYDFVKSNSDAQLLAKPQVRISEGEKGKVHIGDRVPIPVTSFNSSNTVGGNIVPITSFQYQDVGIKLDLEPRVHHNKEITLKLQIEISQISGYADAGGGQRQPIIGTRTIESTIRLKDGETNFLAGLIRTDETLGETGIPGLSDIPIIGRLFGKQTTDTKRTDVMLTLTPHIIRTPDVTEADLLPIWVGTESNITFRGGSPRVESDAEGPFEQPSAEEGVEEKIREQVQRLPRGLREEGRPAFGPLPVQPAPEQEEPPGGVNLAPGGAPSNPFGPRQQPPATEEEPPGGGGLASTGTGEPLEVVPSASSAGGGAVTLSLTPATALVAPGETFEVVLAVETTTAVSHLPTTLSYDAEHLAVERVVPGDFLGGERAAQILADASSPGEIVVGASRLGERPGVAGRGSVVRVVFRALRPGPAQIAIAAERVMDRDLREIASVVGAAVEVRVRDEGGPKGPKEKQAPEVDP